MRDWGDGMNKSMAIWSICLVLVVLLVFSSEDVSAQSPCDNVTQYLESEGKITKPYTVFPFEYPETGNYSIEGIQFNYIKVISDNKELVFYVNCESGEIYDREPTSVELLGPIVSKIDIAVRHRAKTLPNGTKIPIEVCCSVGEENLDKLASAGMEINETQMKRVRERSLKYGTPLFQAFGSVAVEDVYKIAEFSFVDKILYHVKMSFVGGEETGDTTPSEVIHPPKPLVVVLANSTPRSRLWWWRNAPHPLPRAYLRLTISNL